MHGRTRKAEVPLLLLTQAKIVLLDLRILYFVCGDVLDMSSGECGDPDEGGYRPFRFKSLLIDSKVRSELFK